MSVKNDLIVIRQALEQTKGRIEIDIDGDGGSSIHCQVSDYMALIVAINEIVLVANKQTGESFEETIENVKLLRKICNVMECESKEQLDVVKEILKVRDKD